VVERVQLVVVDSMLAVRFVQLWVVDSKLVVSRGLEEIRLLNPLLELVEELLWERICLTQSLIVEMALCWAGLETTSRTVLRPSLLCSIAGGNTDSGEEISASVEEKKGSAVAPILAALAAGDNGSAASDWSHSVELEPRADVEVVQLESQKEWHQKQP
jgi:hypothetical protein